MRGLIENQIKKIGSMVQTGHQITKEFATNVFEIKVAAELKVRVLQPCKNFYTHAISSWLRIGEDRSLPLFLMSVKESMALEWTEGLMKPAYEFYEIANTAWELHKHEGYYKFIEVLLSNLYSTW